MATPSKAQIDRLGDRLRKTPLGENDLRLLDEYRRSFGDAYDTVVRDLRERLHLQPTGRPAKSTTSIIEKLRRESIRLSQIQDIAGCRIVVTDIVEQERVVESLKALFPGASLVDRRIDPSHGYRAVHVIARISGQLIEIQVRTTLQHLWAEFSERLSDRVDPSFKYGGGDDQIRQALSEIAEVAAELEIMEKDFAKIVAGSQQETLLGERLPKLKQRIMDRLNGLIFLIEKLH
jgi:putative GTP pyrophosphokinase